MDAPANVTRFKKLVTWLCNQLQDGKTVHVGCIGGHGRTGTVISAIVAELLEEKDAIQWVRKHYCKKAVESKAQVAVPDEALRCVGGRAHEERNGDGVQKWSRG